MRSPAVLERAAGTLYETNPMLAQVHELHNLGVVFVRQSPSECPIQRRSSMAPNHCTCSVHRHLLWEENDEISVKPSTASARIGQRPSRHPSGSIKTRDKNPLGILLITSR